MLTSTGQEADYYIHEGSDAVICVCVRDDGKILIERQYRPPVGKVSVDYPAGGMEGTDASAKEAMARELLEETGLEAATVTKLASLDKDPGFTSARLHAFLVQGAVARKASPDATESIVSDWVTPTEILAMQKDGTMSCTNCLATTLFAFQALGLLQPPA
jgi:ADP-ribose pyrophosphatase